MDPGEKEERRAKGVEGEEPEGTARHQLKDPPGRRMRGPGTERARVAFWAIPRGTWCASAAVRRSSTGTERYVSHVGKKTTWSTCGAWRGPLRDTRHHNSPADQDPTVAPGKGKGTRWRQRYERVRVLLSRTEILGKRVKDGPDLRSRRLGRGWGQNIPDMGPSLDATELEYLQQRLAIGKHVQP